LAGVDKAGADAHPKTRTGGVLLQISFSGRHVEVSNDVKAYAEKKMAKMPRYYDRIRAIDVVLDHESDNFSVEVIISADGNPFVAREVGPDTFALIDAVADKLERQLVKHKERFRNRKHLGQRPDKEAS
jgi:putative sigma-54 modulation protein